jgi:hypothetical protein
VSNFFKNPKSFLTSADYKTRTAVGLVFILIVCLIFSIIRSGRNFMHDPLWGSDNSSQASTTVRQNIATTTPNVITKKGSEVDPVLKFQIIAAFDKRKALFEKGDAAEIRQYFKDAEDSIFAIFTKQISIMFASDMAKNSDG